MTIEIQSAQILDDTTLDLVVGGEDECEPCPKPGMCTMVCIPEDDDIADARGQTFKVSAFR